MQDGALKAEVPRVLIVGFLLRAYEVIELKDSGDGKLVKGQNKINPLDGPLDVEVEQNLHEDGEACDPSVQVGSIVNKLDQV